MKEPKKVELSYEEVENLKQKILSGYLNDAERKLLCDVLQLFLWIQFEYGKKKNTVSRLLKRIFGSKTEKKPRDKKTNDKNDSPTEKGSSSQNSSNNSSNSSDNATTEAAKRSGHGCHSTDEYTGAKEVHCSHPEHAAGNQCPECKKGRIYPVSPGTFIKVIGQPFISATKYVVDKLKCNLCGEIFSAPLPEGVTKEKWDPSANTASTILKYGYGFPQYRQEAVLKAQGLPISDSTLYDKSEEVANASQPIVKMFKDEIKKTESFIFTDDTSSKVLELMKENKEGAPKRVGIYTSAITGKSSDGHTIQLYMTGRKNAGENLDELLINRDPLLKPPHIMADGSSSNFPEKIKFILSNCLTHARREFNDIEASFPIETQTVLNLIGLIYKNDNDTKSMLMSAQERMAYHIKNSKALVEELFDFLKKCKTTIEPNSDLGRAIRYTLKRQEQLTRFLNIPGAPLDNNLAERVIKKFVLYRKNSYFYFSQVSALIGDILMSMIHTTIANGADPFHYLTQIQIHKKAIFKNPELWMPWNYKLNLLSATVNSV